MPRKSSAYKKVTGTRIKSIRVVQSSCGVSHQIHHPNDFLVCGRVFGFSYVTFIDGRQQRDNTVRIKLEQEAISIYRSLMHLILILFATFL